MSKCLGFVSKQIVTRLLQWATRKLLEVENMDLFREIDYFFFKLHIVLGIYYKLRGSRLNLN